MGSHRKGRRHHHASPHAHASHAPPLDEDPTETAEMEDDHSPVARSLDFSKVLQDVEDKLVSSVTSTVVTGLGSVVGVEVIKQSSRSLNGNNSVHNSKNHHNYYPVFSSSNNDGSSLQSFWSNYSQGLGRECLWLAVAVLSLACLSIFMGVAAGITISIHYFDTSTTWGLPRMEARERDLGAHQRVTTWDPSIASFNIMVPRNPPPFVLAALEYSDHNKYRMDSNSDEAANDDDYDDMHYDISDLTLGRVITMTQNGRRNVLLVVEEITPLHAEVNNSDRPTTTCGSQQQQQSNSYCGATGAIPSFRTRTIQEEQEVSMLRRYGYQPYRHRGPPNKEMSFASVHPRLCPDGVTVGYRDWETLKKAVEEANALSAERFMRWNEYYAGLDDISSNQPGSPDVDRPPKFDGGYYEDAVVFTICPGATLRGRRGPIFINAENVVIECGTSGDYYNAQDFYQAEYDHRNNDNKNNDEETNDNTTTCRIAVGGTHLAFGPHAKNVLVRGITFQQASTSSLTFYYDGAQASFEDCLWTVDNQSSDGTLYGAVADVNSTSQVNFYRCDTIGALYKSGRGLFGGGSFINRKGGASGNGNVGGQTPSTQASLAAVAPGFASFLALRS